jgi:hypothetical protein
MQKTLFHLTCLLACFDGRCITVGQRKMVIFLNCNANWILDLIVLIKTHERTRYKN